MDGIIFICNANRCRSAMAEAILKKKLSESGIHHISVSSMGIYAAEGQPATERAIAVCREQGIDLLEHRSRPLMPDELKMSSLILTMEPHQIDYLDTFFPQVSDRVYMLASWPKRKGKKAAIPDPGEGGSVNAHRKTFRILDEHIDPIASLLRERYRTV